VGEIFVFGSNLRGEHGKGAALHAREFYGAEYGIGEGPTGNAYAIPTKDERLRTRTLAGISHSVAAFLAYAAAHPELTFKITAIGTGLAGYSHEQIAPMLKDAPSNCVLPEEWRDFIQGGGRG
jgi:hypothetical protein